MVEVEEEVVEMVVVVVGGKERRTRIRTRISEKSDSSDMYSRSRTNKANVKSNF